MEWNPTAPNHMNFKQFLFPFQLSCLLCFYKASLARPFPKFPSPFLLRCSRRLVASSIEDSFWAGCGQPTYDKDLSWLNFHSAGANSLQHLPPIEDHALSKWKLSAGLARIALSYWKGFFSRFCFRISLSRHSRYPNPPWISFHQFCALPLCALTLRTACYSAF